MKKLFIAAALVFGLAFAQPVEPTYSGDYIVKMEVWDDEGVLFQTKNHFENEEQAQAYHAMVEAWIAFYNVDDRYNLLDVYFEE